MRRLRLTRVLATEGLFIVTLNAFLTGQRENSSMNIQRNPHTTRHTSALKRKPAGEHPETSLGEKVAVVTGMGVISAIPIVGLNSFALARESTGLMSKAQLVSACANLAGTVSTLGAAVTGNSTALKVGLGCLAAAGVTGVGSLYLPGEDISRPGSHPM